jgi:hypothetical protein
LCPAQGWAIVLPFPRMKRIFGHIAFLASCSAAAVASPVLQDIEFVFTNAVRNSGEAWDAETNIVTPSVRQFWRLRTALE